MEKFDLLQIMNNAWIAIYFFSVMFLHVDPEQCKHTSVSAYS